MSNIRQENRPELVRPQQSIINNQLQKQNNQNFNKMFEEAMKKNKEEVLAEQQRKFSDMEQEEVTPLLSQMNLLNIIIGIKNTFFGIFDDIFIKRKINLEVLTKENRLFYIGIATIIIVMLFYILEILLDTFINENNPNNQNKKVEIYHYYYNKE
jgi:hypothetical protein